MTSTNSMLSQLTSIIINHMYVSQSTQIQTNSIQANYYRENISLVSNQLNAQGSKIILNSMCNLFNNRILTQKVNDQNDKIDYLNLRILFFQYRNYFSNLVGQINRVKGF